MCKRRQAVDGHCRWHGRLCIPAGKQNLILVKFQEEMYKREIYFNFCQVELLHKPYAMRYTEPFVDDFVFQKSFQVCHFPNIATSTISN